VVRFKGDTELRAVGPITGASYALTPGDTILLDPRDAVVMVRDRRLQIEAIVVLTDGASQAAPSLSAEQRVASREPIRGDDGGL
jgi:hypothetical protein